MPSVFEVGDSTSRYTMTDRERINKVYGLLAGAGANSYILKDGSIEKVPIPIKILSEAINILDDKNYKSSSNKIQYHWRPII
jgi:hypothetical protein